MGNTEAVREKVAWVLTRDGRVLQTRTHGKTIFNFPGGMREPGETDAQTLAREIDEELRTAIDTASMRHVGTFAMSDGPTDRVTFRMICYTARHTGPLTPAAEIAEIAWFHHADRDRVAPVDRKAMDALHTDGTLR
ncbi:NUDIX hydrolase [Spirillospora sp. CA-294931]|uniref:NUDIX hydrolase n=1 Tax=Spirillospora sp. CA-294931 TaxID=3240042 RepID=UPI003D942756